jgi:hypothetical protein
MKKVLFLISMTLCSNAFAQTEKIDNSITIHNLSNAKQQLWVNAVTYNVASTSSLRVPCNTNENIEVQYLDDSKILNCGSMMEIK